MAKVSHRANQDLLNKLHMRSREWDAMCDKWIEDAKQISDDVTAEHEAIMRKNLHKDAAAEIEKLEEDYIMVESIMSSFFDLAKKTEADIEPILMDGVRGYLRTSKNGGMNPELADAVEAVLADFIRLYAGKALVPVLRGIASDNEQVLKASRSV